MATVSRRLPQRPHLDIPKREARELLNAWRAAQSRTGTLTVILVGKQTLKTSFTPSLATDNIAQTLVEEFQS